MMLDLMMKEAAAVMSRYHDACRVFAHIRLGLAIRAVDSGDGGATSLTLLRRRSTVDHVTASTVTSTPNY